MEAIRKDPRFNCQVADEMLDTDLTFWLYYDSREDADKACLRVPGRGKVYGYGEAGPVQKGEFLLLCTGLTRDNAETFAESTDGRLDGWEGAPIENTPGLVENLKRILDAPDGEIQ